jgi:hypothetical protein
MLLSSGCLGPVFHGGKFSRLKVRIYEGGEALVLRQRMLHLTLSRMRITMVLLVRICLLEFWRSPDVLGEVHFSIPMSVAVVDCRYFKSNCYLEVEE